MTILKGPVDVDEDIAEFANFNGEDNNLVSVLLDIETMTCSCWEVMTGGYV